MRDIDITIKKMYLAEGKKLNQIASELEISEEYVMKVTKKLIPLKRSKGEVSLSCILQKIYPNQKIEEQVPFHGQYFDFYLPRLRIAWEVDGIQHSEQNAFFHGEGTAGAYKFEEGQAMDRRKDALAKREHIYVIRIPHTTKLNEETIRGIIDEHNDKIVANLSAYNSSARL